MSAGFRGYDPIFSAMDLIAAHSELWSSTDSRTRRIARSLTSGEYLDFRVVITPSSQDVEPSTILGGSAGGAHQFDSGTVRPDRERCVGRSSCRPGRRRLNRRGFSRSNCRTKQVEPPKPLTKCEGLFFLTDTLRVARLGSTCRHARAPLGSIRATRIGRRVATCPRLVDRRAHRAHRGCGSVDAGKCGGRRGVTYQKTKGLYAV